MRILTALALGVLFGGCSLDEQVITATRIGGDTAGDTAASGDGAAGDSLGGDPVAGDPVAGDPVAGDPVAGDPLTGDPIPGDPMAGDPNLGDPSSGDPVPVETITVVPVYPSLAEWNEYVYWGDPTNDTYHQPTSGPPALRECTGADSAEGWQICIHGGERRKAAVTSRSECAGLTATDSLGAFDWFCLEESGDAVFYMRGLKHGVGLSDLLGSGGFLDSSLEVREGATVIAESTPGIWWSNPVAVLPDNDGGSVILLDDTDDDGAGPDEAYAEGTILALRADRGSAGYNFGNDRLILVTGDSTLTFDGGGDNCNDNATLTAPVHRCLLAAGARSFLWLEGNFEAVPAAGSTAEYLLRLVDSTFLRLRNVTAQGALDTGVLLVNGGASVLQSIRVAKNGDNGIELFRSERNHVSDVVATNNRDADSGRGVRLAGSADWNTLARIISSGAYYDGLEINDSDHNNVSQLVTVNNGYYGLHLTSGARWNNISHATVANNNLRGVFVASSGQINQRNRLTQIVAVNNGDVGFWIGSNTSDTLVTHLVATNNEGNGVKVDGTDTRFAGWLILGNNTGTECSIGGTGTNVSGSDCTESDADLEVVLDGDLSATFEGLSATDDTNGNGAQLAGGFLDGDDITDWLHFQYPQRIWGLGGSTTPLDTANQGPCDTGLCAIWDWRVQTGDSAIRRLHGTASAGSACPAPILGDEAIIDSQGSNVYLEAAIEILDDDIGDEDGLCEGGETCVFAATPGAHGGDVVTTGECTFTSGTVAGVTMLLYEGSDS